MTIDEAIISGSQMDDVVPSIQDMASTARVIAIKPLRLGRHIDVVNVVVRRIDGAIRRDALVHE